MIKKPNNIYLSYPCRGFPIVKPKTWNRKNFIHVMVLPLFYAAMMPLIGLFVTLNCNAGQNIATKVKKSGKIWQEKQTLISVFTLFLNVFTDVLFLQGTRLCAYSI